MGKSRKGLGVLALIIAIGALGLSIYQFVLSSGGVTVYTETNEDTFYLNSNTYEVIPNLNISCSTKTGDSVLLEFSCRLSIELFGSSTTVFMKFEIDGLAPTPDTEISATVFSPDIYANVPFIMRHNVPAISGGSHVVKVLIKIDDTVTTSFVKFCVLTATVS